MKRYSANYAAEVRGRAETDDTRRPTRRSLLLAACAWPLLIPVNAAHAQVRLPKIGVLRTQNASDNFYQSFLLGLRELGYIEGKSIQIEYLKGDAARLPELAEELVRSKVSLIFAPTPPAAHAARKVTTTLPIVVAVVGDPVAAGLAARLARPGGNVTGLTALGSNLSGKRLEILKDVAPRLARVAVLWNPAVPDKVIEWNEMQEPAHALKIELLSVEVRAADDFERAFEAAHGGRAEALIGLPEPLMFSQMGRVIEFAARARLPSVFAWREAADAGALIAYGPNIADLYRRSAVYVDKILKGAKPGDLPIEEPSRFDFVVNLKTAKALGIKIPNSILVRADKVIE